MKSFRQFMEQPEIINMMKGFAQQNKKSPKEYCSMNINDNPYFDV